MPPRESRFSIIAAAVALAFQRTRLAGTPGKIKSRMRPESSDASRSTSGPAWLAQ
jgi:hypothetical protein